MDPEQDDYAAALRFGTQMGDATRQLAAGVTTPIIGRTPDGPAQVGTGTLFRIGDRPFLVTALHVITTARNNRWDLSMLTGEAPYVPVPLVGDLLTGDDPFDIACIELPSDAEERLVGKRWLNLAHVDFGEVKQGWFWVGGFPVSKTTRGADGTSFNLTAVWLGGPLFEENLPLVNDDEYQPRFHILLSRDRDDIVGRDGSPAEFEERLNGISGCSIWQSCKGRAILPSWGPESIRVVGVQTSVFRRAIKGTYWRWVGAMLWKERPELQNALTVGGFR